MDFKNIYSKTPDHLKLRFLKAIIENNEHLRKEFTAFVKNQDNEVNKLSYNGFIDIVRNTSNDYKGRFEKIDTENPDWENYHPPHSGYIEDWEAYQYASEQEIDVIFDKFQADALNKIIGQQFDELTALLIGLYEATLDAEIDDEVASFGGDVNEYLLLEHSNTLNSVSEKLRLSAVSEIRLNTAFDLFFKYCDSEYPGNRACTDFCVNG